MMHSSAQSTTTNRPKDTINLEPRHRTPPVHDTIRDFVRRETITLLTDQPTETYVQSLRRQQHSLLDAQIAENQRIDQQLLHLDRESRRLQRLRSEGDSSIALLQAFSATIHSQTSHLSTAVAPVEATTPSPFTRQVELQPVHPHGPPTRQDDSTLPRNTDAPIHHLIDAAKLRNRHPRKYTHTRRPDQTTTRPIHPQTRTTQLLPTLDTDDIRP